MEVLFIRMHSHFKLLSACYALEHACMHSLFANKALGDSIKLSSAAKFEWNGAKNGQSLLYLYKGLLLYGCTGDY